MFALRARGIALFQARHLALLRGGWLVFAEYPASDFPAETAQQEEKGDGEDDHQDLCGEREPAPVGEEMADDGNAQAGDARADQQAHADAEATAEWTAVDIPPRFRGQLCFGRARRLRCFFLYGLFLFPAIFLLELLIFAFGPGHVWHHNCLFPLLCW